MSNAPRSRSPARIPLALLVAGFTGLLAACASSPSGQAPSEPPVAQNWPVDSRLEQEQGAAAAQLSWRAYFADPDLVQLIETALENNRDLRLAVLRVQEARAAYGIQRSEQFPMVGVGGQAARSRVPGDLNPAGRSVVAGDYEAYVGFNAWELDLWGRVRSLREAALQEYLATDVAQRGIRLSLVAEVANAYLGLRELDERLALAAETIATREESYRIFRRRNEVGSVSTLDLTQVETLLNQAQALGAQLQKARASQAHALTLLVGSPLDLPPLANTRLRDDVVFAPLRAGLPADLLTVRPDIVAAEHRLSAAQADIHAARAAFFPRIALTGTFGTASAQLDGLFDAGSRAWTFAPTISLPIFDGGRRRASLDLAEVRGDMAVAEYERTIQIAFREVADALSSRKWLTQQVAIQRNAVDTQSRRARLAQLRYDNGAAAYLEVLDAQRDLLDAQQQLVQVRRALLSTHIALYTALGGGTAAAPDGSSSPVASSIR